MSKSSTTIDTSEWLHIPHAGELLLSEFMEPYEMDAPALATAIAIRHGSKPLSTVQSALTVNSICDLPAISACRKGFS